MTLTVQMIPIDKLHFDPLNPRLPSTLQRAPIATVLEWMLRDGTLLELMQSISAQGYFEGEPLLVVKDTNTPDHYQVIEGNRRLSATKILLNPSLAPIHQNAVQQIVQNAQYKPEKLPVVIFETRNEILNYLGYRHITGVKPWSSLAKAKYLKQLLDSIAPDTLERQYSYLAKVIGSRSDYVARLLSGLAVYEQIVHNNFFNIRSISEDTFDFSVLTTALSYKNISNFVGLSEDDGNRFLDPSQMKIDTSNLRELTEWMFEKNDQNKTRIGESRNLKNLNKVVANPQALEKFREGLSLKESVLFTDEPDEVFRVSVNDAKTNIQNARNYSHLVTRFSKNDTDTLLEIIKISRFIRSFIEEMIEDEK